EEEPADEADEARQQAAPHTRMGPRHRAARTAGLATDPAATTTITPVRARTLGVVPKASSANPTPRNANGTGPSESNVATLWTRPISAAEAPRSRARTITTR